MIFYSRKHKKLKTKNLAIWIETKLGLGLSLNYIPLRMGYEPFILAQFLCFMLFVSPRSQMTGDKYNLEKECLEEI